MERPGDQQWYMLIGKGNSNGGDGLVAWRHLVEAGLDVTLVYADAPDALRGEAAVQRDAAAKVGIPASCPRARSRGIQPVHRHRGCANGHRLAGGAAGRLRGVD